jgi:predicted Fe-S protein YdhL (DUF1289 family)
MMPDSAGGVQSPCIKLCVMDAASGLCTGCGRTLDEIARWGTMTEAERAKILTDLKAGRRVWGN